MLDELQRRNYAQNAVRVGHEQQRSEIENKNRRDTTATWWPGSWTWTLRLRAPMAPSQRAGGGISQGREACRGGKEDWRCPKSGDQTDAADECRSAEADFGGNQETLGGIPGEENAEDEDRGGGRDGSVRYEFRSNP
jgi:hypothetical protein